MILLHFKENRKEHLKGKTNRIRAVPCFVGVHDETKDGSGIIRGDAPCETGCNFNSLYKGAGGFFFFSR